MYILVGYNMMVGVEELNFYKLHICTDFVKDFLFYLLLHFYVHIRKQRFG